MSEPHTIDITPSWKSLVRPLLDAYAASKSPSAKADIIHEFERMAEVVDNLNSNIKQK